jgi:small subunit ribosomal protein S19e|tara:strand:+ start:1215 stop:1694 length:480 start_codon:yes stop_codon:yes gene_type:complete
MKISSDETMPTVHDVPQDVLIKELSEKLKKDRKIKAPEWSLVTKTGSHAERSPQDQEWWYIRCASLFRKVYLRGPVGLTNLVSEYGGRKKLSFRPGHHRDAGGAIIRNALQQLDDAGFVTKYKNKGRVVTPKGRSFIDKLSGEILKESIKSNPVIAEYS